MHTSPNKIPSSPTKAGAKVAIVALCMLLLGAIWFYRERMLFTDASLILFQIINYKTLSVSDRYGAFITQVFPLVGSWLHVPLKYLMVLYSTSFVVVYMLAAGLLWKLKRFDLIILSVLYILLFNTESYYWTNNEVHQGVVILFCNIAVLGHLANKKAHWIVHVLLFVPLYALALWTHPLIIIAAVYLWFFQMLTGYQWHYKKKEGLLYTSLLLAICYLKYWYAHLQTYDSAKLIAVNKMSSNSIAAVFQTSQMRLFWSHLIAIYWPAALLYLLTMAVLLWQRKFLVLLYATIASVGFIFIICVTFPDALPYLYYIESEYMMLTILLMAPFVMLVIPIMQPRIVIGLLAVVFAIKCIHIYNASYIFKARVDQTVQVLQKMKERNITKLVIPENESLRNTYLMTWGAPFESILLSASAGATTTSTFIIMQPSQPHIRFLTERNLFFTCFENYDVAKLNQYYFHLDTTISYTTMDLAEVMQ